MIGDDFKDDYDSEWETPLTLNLSVGTVIDTVFATADAAHVGRESCVDPQLMVVEVVAHDDHSDTNYCRYSEQEYHEGENANTVWHDWTVELHFNAIIITAHWRAKTNGRRSDWKRCAEEAEKAFVAASVLVGKRVRRGVVVEQSSYKLRTSRTQH